MEQSGSLLYLWLAMAALLGAVFGSFINAAAWRIPNGISIADGRSRCPQCEKQIAWFDNIPLLSYLLLWGRCRNCREAIGIRYFATELVAMLGLTWTAWLYRDPLVFAWAGLFFLLLLLLSIIDLEYMILPDKLTLPGAAIFLAASFLPGTPVLWQDALIGGFGAFGLLWGVSLSYRALRGIDGLGFGDVKLMLLLGAVLGVQGILLAIVLGSLSGLVIGGSALAIKGGGARTRIPFGPFLALGALLSLWFGAQLSPLLFHNIP